LAARRSARRPPGTSVWRRVLFWGRLAQQNSMRSCGVVCTTPARSSFATMPAPSSRENGSMPRTSSTARSRRAADELRPTGRRDEGRQYQPYKGWRSAGTGSGMVPHFNHTPQRDRFCCRGVPCGHCGRNRRTAELARISQRQRITETLMKDYEDLVLQSPGQVARIVP
jgi:hypothetical protein